MMKGKCAAAVLLAVSIASCDSADPAVDEWMTPEEALPEIREHVAAFLAEADARKRTPYLYKPSELVIEVADVLEREGKDVCGYGELDSETQRPLIAFAITKGCWDRSRWDREILVFHEMGHALLGRDHRDDVLPNGLRASIMNSGNIFGLYSDLRAEHRGYYLDELFNPETPAPVWGY